MTDFDELSERVHGLYSEREYESGRSLVESSFESFSDHRATLIYWRACFDSLLGEPAKALKDLQDGLVSGLWWAEPTLREDPDLEAVRRLEGFQAVAVESGRRWREAMSGPPEPPTVIPAATAHRATLVVLQGGSGSMDRVAQQWHGAANLGCTVIVPGRGQPSTSDGDHANWIDEERTDEVLRATLGGAELGTVLVAGFSAGGREALRIGLTGSPVHAAGLLLFGPAPLSRTTEGQAAAERGLRVWTFVGSDDWLLDEVLATDRTLRGAGIEVLEHKAAGVGHVVPDNLSDLLPAALAFVLAP
jgi:dienelactone hydrolase